MPTTPVAQWPKWPKLHRRPVSRKQLFQSVRPFFCSSSWFMNPQSYTTTRIPMRKHINGKTRGSAPTAGCMFLTPQEQCFWVAGALLSAAKITENRNKKHCFWVTEALVLHAGSIAFARQQHCFCNAGRGWGDDFCVHFVW